MLGDLTGTMLCKPSKRQITPSDGCQRVQSSKALSSKYLCCYARITNFFVVVKKAKTSSAPCRWANDRLAGNNHRVTSHPLLSHFFSGSNFPSEMIARRITADRFSKGTLIFSSSSAGVFSRSVIYCL